MLTISIFQRSKVTTSINTIYKDLSSDSEKHYFAKNSAFFALNLNGANSDKLLDPTYFKFEMNQIHNERANYNETFTKSVVPIEYEL